MTNKRHIGVPGVASSGGTADGPGGARVTTVVMTRNRLDDLRRTLPRHTSPVILVDNGSVDGTVEYVRRTHPHIEVIALDRNLGAPARNLAVRQARTPLVAFADDDSWWAPGALKRAAGYFASYPRLGVLAARVLVGVPELIDPVSAAMRTAPLGRARDLPGPSVLGFIACGAVVRRSAFLSVGGFDDVIGFAGEEERVALDLAVARWGLAYADDVVAHHHPSAVRNRREREIVVRRNRLLTALLRRRWSTVAHEITTALRTPDGVRSLGAAAGSVPAALRQRAAIPPELERTCRRLARLG
ncbi:glycosyltransferase family 2 protein [Epidermidibacterium keratini]|nr:glycosyltransferase [Epidermidibacterium keratini]